LARFAFEAARSSFFIVHLIPSTVLRQARLVGGCIFFAKPRRPIVFCQEGRHSVGFRVFASESTDQRIGGHGHHDASSQRLPQICGGELIEQERNRARRF
jgi:hypothetical protein